MQGRKVKELIMSTTRWVTFILGLWIALSAFFGFGGQGYLWSDLLSGLIAVGAGVALAKESALEGWFAAILGAWMFIAAFVPALHQGGAMYWNNILVGGVIALVGLIPAGTSGRPHPAA
jgi:hypothetical protein